MIFGRIACSINLGDIQLWKNGSKVIFSGASGRHIYWSRQCVAGVLVSLPCLAYAFSFLMRQSIPPANQRQPTAVI